MQPCSPLATIRVFSPRPSSPPTTPPFAITARAASPYEIVSLRRLPVRLYHPQAVAHRVAHGASAEPDHRVAPELLGLRLLVPSVDLFLGAVELGQLLVEGVVAEKED